MALCPSRTRGVYLLLHGKACYPGRKNWEAARSVVATKYEKRAVNYRATVMFAALINRLPSRNAERALALEFQRTPDGKSVD